MPYNFELPPTITGKTPDEQIKQLQNYIYKLVQDLNYFAERGTATSKGLTLDELSLKLESNAETINDKADKSSVKKVEKKATTIEANVDGFRAEVSKTYTTINDTNLLEERVTAAESAIEVNAEGIKTKVEKNGVMSAIEQSPENIKIQANRVDIDNLFSQNITMSGTFTATAQVYIPPDEEILEKIKNHIFKTELIPDSEFSLYDFNGNGAINSNDFTICKSIIYGTGTLQENHVNAQPSTVTITIAPSNIAEAIKITGTDMWGRSNEIVIGSNGVLSRRINGEIVKATKLIANDITTYEEDTPSGSVNTGTVNADEANIGTIYPNHIEQLRSMRMVFDENLDGELVDPWLNFEYADGSVVEIAEILKGLTGNIQSQLNARKRTWECPTKVGEYSRLCWLNNSYMTYLLTISLAQDTQAISHSYLISQGYATATIVQIGGNAFIQNSGQTVRLVADGNVPLYVELLNNYGASGATTVTARCSILPLGNGGSITTYTEYTATTGGTIRDYVDSIPSGLAGALGKVVYEVDPDTTNGIYCNGKTAADSANSVTISDRLKRYKRLKIYARGPYAMQIQEFDLAMTTQNSAATYGNRTGGFLMPAADNTSGANNHYLYKINFCVKETTAGWTLQITDSGWIHLGIPAASTTQYAGTDLTINGTAYAKWNQRHNFAYCVYKIVGYED